MADDKKIIELVSGGGTNLQALIDAQNRGELGGGRISCVISSKPDWKTIAADEEWFVFVTCHIPPEADAAAYTEKMQAVYEEYRAAAVEPQSYAFSLGITDGDSAEIIWSVLAAFGEEYDENSHFGYDMTQAEKLREAYAQ